MSKPRTTDEMFFRRVREIAERLHARPCPHDYDRRSGVCIADCLLCDDNVVASSSCCIAEELAVMTGLVDADGEPLDWDGR